MSVGFGFSAGDFIAALQLVSTIIDALRDSGDPSTEYRALIQQLFSLETALLKVKRLEVDNEQHDEVIALRQAACQCQNTIDDFWQKIKKYQPCLRTGGSGSRVKDGWRKIQWAVCKKDDLVKFKADLVGHTESIDLLLMTLNMGFTRIESQKQEENHKTLAGKVQESYFGCMQKLTQMMDIVSNGVEQGKKILEMTATVIKSNVQVFHIVLNIQSIITRLPGQVERQQPVYFIDALGRHRPFFLEFILSAEALTHVLRCDLKNIGSGAQKIDRGEFAIQDTCSKSDVNLKGCWEGCFRPGQRVDMSMVFLSKKTPSRDCPACKRENEDEFEEDQDVDCKHCGVTYRRSVAKVFAPNEAVIPTPPRSEDPLARFFMPLLGDRKRKRNDDEDDDMVLFRRVRVKASVILSSRLPLESPIAVPSAEPTVRKVGLAKSSEDHDQQPQREKRGPTEDIHRKTEQSLNPRKNKKKRSKIFQHTGVPPPLPPPRHIQGPGHEQTNDPEVSWRLVNFQELPDGLPTQTKEENTDPHIGSNNTLQPLSTKSIWDRLQALQALGNGEVDLDLLCEDLQKRAKCTISGPVVQEADFDEIMKRYLTSKQPQVCTEPKSIVPIGQLLDQLSSGPQPWLFTYPPTYGSFQNPLQPEEWYKNRETDSSSTYSQRPVPNSTGPLPFSIPTVPQNGAALYGCSSGDTCQSIGCEFHPYNDATQQYVRSAYGSSGFSGTSVERDKQSQLFSVTPI